MRKSHGAFIRFLRGLFNIGGGAAAKAELESRAIVPGDVCPSKCPHVHSGVIGTDLEPIGGRQQNSKV